MKVYPELRHQALRGAMTVLETAQDPGSVTLHIADLHAAIDNSPLGEITRQRLLEDDDRRVLAMRWEDGREEPIRSWRERVGLTKLLARTPLAEEMARLS